MRSRRLRQLVASTAALSLLVSAQASANPSGGTVSAGGATFESQGNQLNIHQSTNKAVIDWQSFDIGADESTRFFQPSSSSLTLNRVHSNSASQIMGQLSANGGIMIINQNGVLFGQQAQVDVGSLVVSTADISNSDFMAGTYNFNQAGNADAKIVNQGTITVKEAGLVGLVAPQVENSGVINARMSRVALASGDTFTLDMYGDDLINVSLAGDVAGQIIRHSGTINAQGGSVVMTAAAARDVVDSLIDVSGTVHANKIDNSGGRIVIQAEGSNGTALAGNSKVLVSGHLEATGEQGGDIEILGDQVAILNGGIVDASGTGAGGTVHVGGEYLGGGDTQRAKATIIQSDAVIKANGGGGEVIAWSDNYTDFKGTIEANGGGGFVETSSKNILSATGRVFATGGSWLLDPGDITVRNDAGGGPDDTDTTDADGPLFEAPVGTAAIVTTEAIESALFGTDGTDGADVTVRTGTGGGGNGDIFIDGDIQYIGGAARSLIFEAYRHILMDFNEITSTGAALNVTMNSRYDGASATGRVRITGGSQILTNGGNFLVGGGVGAAGYAVGSSDGGQNSAVVLWNSRVETDGGDITIRGQSGTDSDTVGIFVFGGSDLVTTTGNITLDGRSGAGNDFMSGVVVDGATTVTTTSGNISITGEGGGAAVSNSFGVHLSGGALVETVGGNITIDGTASSDDSHGIFIETGALVNTASGDIGMVASASGANSFGVNIDDGDVVTTTGAVTLDSDDIRLDASTISAGDNIHLEADGGDILIGGDIIYTGAAERALLIEAFRHIEMDAGSIDSTTGELNVTLNSRYTGGADGHIYFDNAVIDTNGGDLLVGGDAGAAGRAIGSGDGSGFDGVEIVESTINTGIGAITMRGQSGGDLFTSGISVWDNTTIDTTSGNITLDGLGVAAADAIFGINIETSSITTQTGQINLTGQGGASGDNDPFGIWIRDGAVIESTGAGGGSINITGTGGTSANGGSIGVWLLNADIISNAAAINIEGYGNASGGDYNTGFSMSGNSTVHSVSGNIDIYGEGGNGNDINHGILLDGNGATTEIYSGSGDIRLEGLGGGGIASGIAMENAARIYTTSAVAGQGDIELIGTGGSSGAYSAGVYTHAGFAVNVLETNAGSITVTGQGGAGGDGEVGVWLNDDVSFASNSGDIQVTGTAGTGGNDVHGVFLLGASYISSSTGDIDVQGTSSDNNSYGIYISDGGIVSDGAAAGDITLTAVNSAFTDFATDTSATIGDYTVIDSLKNITINADEVNMASTTIDTLGAVTFATRTQNQDINLGGNTGGLDLSDTELGFISNNVSQLIFRTTTDGGFGNGYIDVDSWDLTGKTFDLEFYGGEIEVDGLTNGVNMGMMFEATNDVNGFVNIDGLDITNNDATDRAFTVRASDSIVLDNATIDASAGTGKIDITLHATDSDADDYSEALVDHSTIHTNGGDFLIGGGGNPLTDSLLSGIGFYNSTLTTEAGRISLRGNNESAGGNFITGVRTASLNLETTTGAIDIIGVTDSSGTSNNGVWLQSTAIETASGAITIDGESVVDNTDNNGVLVWVGSSITQTGTGAVGDISITGTTAGTSARAVRLSDTADMTVADADVTITGNTGDVYIAADITKNAGGAASFNVSSDRSIYIEDPGALGGLGLTSTSGAWDIVLNADADANSSGAIALSDVEIITLGGDFTAGGGANPATTATKATGSDLHGVHFDNTVVNTGAGDIIVRGEGLDGSNNRMGILLSGGTTMEVSTGSITLHGTSGTGTSGNMGIKLDGGTIESTGTGGAVGAITLTGIGRGTNSENNGIDLLSGGDRITSIDADITLTGTGAAGSDQNYGVAIGSAVATDSTGAGTGNIAITGTSNGAGNQNYGVYLKSGGDVYTEGSGGDISITGISANAADLFTSGATVDIGRATTSGDILLNVDDIALANTSIDTTGIVTITPRTASRTIGLGGGAGDLNLSDAELGMISTNVDTLIIGDSAAGSGLVDIDTWAFDTMGYDVEVHGGSLDIDGIDPGANALTLNGRTGYVNVTQDVIDFTGATVTAATNIIFNADSDGDDDGYIRLADSTLTVTGGSIYLVGGLDGNADNIGDGSAWGNGTVEHGVTLDNTDLTLANGTLTVRGHGDNTAGDAHGVYMTNDTDILTTNGAVTVTGVGGDTADDNVGVYINSGSASIVTTGGNITLTGTGGNGVDGNRGIDVRGLIQSATGDILLTGTGQGSGTSAAGIILGGVDIISTGAVKATAGTVTLRGYGSTNASGLYSSGIDFDGSSQILSNAGDVLLEGTSGTSVGGNDNWGIVFDSGGYIETTGVGANAASVTMIGTSTGSVNDGNYGVLVQENIVTADGDITISGTSQGNTGGNNNDGVLIEGTAELSSVNGDITLTGISSSDGANSDGVQIDDNASVHTTNGNIVINAESTNGVDLRANGSGTVEIGTAGDSGDITFNVNSISLTNASIDTAGRVTIAPRTAGRAINLGAGAGGLDLTNAELAMISNNVSDLVIGNSGAGTGAVSIDNVDTSARAYNLAVHGGEITVDNGLTGGGTIFLNARNGQDILLNSTITAVGAGNSLVLNATGDFFNTAGAAALVPGAGRYLVYAANSAIALKDSLPGADIFSQTYGSLAPAAVPGVGNTFIFANADPSGPPPSGGGSGGSNTAPLQQNGSVVPDHYRFTVSNTPKALQSSESGSEPQGQESTADAEAEDEDDVTDAKTDDSDVFLFDYDFPYIKFSPDLMTGVTSFYTYIKASL